MHYAPDLPQDRLPDTGTKPVHATITNDSSLQPPKCTTDTRTAHRFRPAPKQRAVHGGIPRKALGTEEGDLR